MRSDVIEWILEIATFIATDSRAIAPASVQSGRIGMRSVTDTKKDIEWPIAEVVVAGTIVGLFNQVTINEIGASRRARGYFGSTEIAPSGLKLLQRAPIKVPPGLSHETRRAVAFLFESASL